MKQPGLRLGSINQEEAQARVLGRDEVRGARLVEIVAPHWPKSMTGRSPSEIETMPRIHYLQQWFGLSDSATEEALHVVPLYREFAKLDGVTR
jgi:transposase, IS5 family